MSKESIPKSVDNAWSEIMHGLAGRIRVEFEDLKPGLRYAIYLELRNHSIHPITVTNQPQIQAELSDSAGKSLNSSSLQMSGPIPLPQWAMIPHEAYLGFRVDVQTLGVPTREHGIALLAIGRKSWELRTGEYVLKATVEFIKEADASPNQWVGKLVLPPVDVVITTQMLEGA